MLAGGRLAGLVAPVAAAALVSGCGSGALPAPTVKQAALPHLTRSSPGRLVVRPRPATVSGLPVGTAQVIESGGSRLTVTVAQVIDPLTAPGAMLLAGTRAVGVIVGIVNSGPEIYDSSATADFSLVTGRGPVTPLYVPSGICRTPLRDFENYMIPGQRREGCVAFAVAARVLGVRFSPQAPAPGHLAWSVPRR